MVGPVIKAESGDFGSSETETTSSNKYKQIFGLREIHLLSVFALIYVGSEVTIGGACLDTNNLVFYCTVLYNIHKYYFYVFN